MAKAPRRPTGLPTPDDLLAFLREAGEAGKADVAAHFGLKGADRRALREMLRDLEGSGKLGKRGRKGYAEAGAFPPVGVADVAERDNDGDLWVRLVKGAGDLPLARLSPEGAESAAGAPGMGDRVLVRFERVGDTTEARLIKRLGQGAARVLGVVRKGRKETRVEPVDRRSKDSFLIPGPDGAALCDGDLVLVEAGDDPRHRYGPKPARVLENVGREDQPRAASLIAVHTHGLPTGFTEAAEREAEAARPPTLKGRDDLRQIPLVTIDPVDARDHDDAVFAEPDTDPKNAGGWIVWVAIADVAAYVRYRTALDKDARDKGNSTYFPDRVEPMLPHALSSDLCSLREGEDRATLAVRMVFDANGAKLSHRFMRGLMRSAAKLSYEQAQAAIDGAPDDRTGPLLKPILEPLWAAYHVMLKGRERRSPLAIESLERKIVLDTEGNVTSIQPRKSLEAHRLIEEMMIQANVCAAETLEQRHTPLIYRVHDTPSQEKIFALADFLTTVGLKWSKGEAPDTKRFNAVLDQARGTENAAIVNEVVLRSQMQATYSPDNVGHFGLHLDRYAHFTSPIRRYADLVIHRALIRALGFTKTDSGDDGLTGEEIARLSDTADHITATERRSMLAERDANDRYVAAFLEDRVGAEFDGRVTGVTRFGLFIRLDETGADGLVPVSQLGQEYFQHDDRIHALVGQRTGRRWRLGREVTVRLLEATPITGGLLFEMVSEPEAADPNAPRPRLGVRGRGGEGPPPRTGQPRGKGRPGGPKPPSGGLKGVRKGKRR